MKIKVKLRRNKQRVTGSAGASTFLGMLHHQNRSLTMLYLVLLLNYQYISKYAIMIENMIFTMSGYFILEKNRPITKMNKLSRYATIKLNYIDTGVAARLFFALSTYFSKIKYLNPRTDGGPGHLSTDGGGG